jgi:hypothetical protein
MYGGFADAEMQGCPSDGCFMFYDIARDTFTAAFALFLFRIRQHTTDPF